MNTHAACVKWCATLLVLVLGHRAAIADDKPFGLTDAKASVYGAALSPDRKSLAVGGFGGLFGTGTWVIWDIESRKEQARGQMKKGSVHCLAVSPAGRYLATGGDGAELKVWDAKSGELVADLQGHRGCLHQVAFTPDGRFLVSLADDQQVRCWNVGKFTPERTFRFRAEDQRLNGWEAYPDRPGESATVVTIWPDTIDRLRGFAISPDAKTIAISVGNQITLFDLTTGKLAGDFKPDQKPSSYSVAFSPDGKTLAAGGACEGRTIELWDLEARKRLKVLRGHTHTVLELEFSPKGDFVVSGGFDGARVWDVATGKQRHHLAIKTERIKAVGFLADGKRFVTVDNKQTVQFRSTDSGEEIDISDQR